MDRGRDDRMSYNYNFHTKIINRTGFLQLHSECSAHAANLILPSSYTGRSRYDDLSLKYFVIPKVGDVLIPLEMLDVSQALNDFVLDVL